MTDQPDRPLRFPEWIDGAPENPQQGDWILAQLDRWHGDAIVAVRWDSPWWCMSFPGHVFSPPRIIRYVPFNPPPERAE